MPQITVETGDLTRAQVDAIVNPANSHGFMGGGVAYAIKRSGGQEIEDEAVAAAPTPVGEAVATTSGKLACQHVIHAPTMTEPTQLTDAGNVRAAVKAALAKAAELNLSSLAFPGMGCGVGGLSKREAAQAMVETIVEAGPKFPVYLIGFDEELTEEFARWLGKSRETESK